MSTDGSDRRGLRHQGTGERVDEVWDISLGQPHRRRAPLVLPD